MIGGEGLGGWFCGCDGPVRKVGFVDVVMICPFEWRLWNSPYRTSSLRLQR